LWPDDPLLLLSSEHFVHLYDQLIYEGIEEGISASSTKIVLQIYFFRALSDMLFLILSLSK
jgi:hypothetical protein